MSLSKDKAPTVPLTTTPMTLFPTASSLQDVVDLGESQLPIKNKNDLFVLLMIYHNTLLKQIQYVNKTTR